MTQAALVDEDIRRPAGGHAAALLLLLAFGVVVTLWLRPRWGISVFQTGIFALGMVWIVTSLVRGVPAARSFCLWPLAGATVWGLVQLAFDQSVYRSETWDAVLVWATNLTVCFLALQICVDPEVRRRFLRHIVYFGLGLTVLATVQAFTSAGSVYWMFPSGYDRVFGPFLSPNQYAAFLESIVPIAVVLAFRDRRRSLLFMIAAGVMVASIIASASRAGAVLVIASVLVALLLLMRSELSRQRTFWRDVRNFAAVAVLATVVVGGAGLWGRLQAADPLEVRRELVESTWNMIRDRPALGSGLGTWATVYPAYATLDNARFVNQAHNDWMQWAAEGGVFFALMLLAVAGWAVRPAVRSVWGLGLLAVFCHAWVDYPLQQRPALAAWFFALLGVLASYSATAHGNSAARLDDAS